MKQRIAAALSLLCLILLSSCGALPLGSSREASVAVGSESFWVKEGTVYSSRFWDEKELTGGGIVPWGASAQEQIPLDEIRTYGISYHDGWWYACEKKTPRCNGEGAQLLRWRDGEQEKVADLCSCDFSSYLVTEQWVFFTQSCETELLAKGLYGYNPQTQRYCFFEGEVTALGLCQGQPYYLKATEQGVALHQILLQGERPVSRELARWEELPGLFRKAQGLFLEGLTVLFVPGEGLCLLKEGQSPCQISLAVDSAVADSQSLYLSVGAAVYRWRPAEGSLERILQVPGKDPRFVLGLLEDGSLVMELSNYQIVDLWLWRWERKYLLSWQEEQGCREIGSLASIQELTESQIPPGLGFPTVF